MKKFLINIAVIGAITLGLSTQTSSFSDVPSAIQGKSAP